MNLEMPPETEFELVEEHGEEKPAPWRRFLGCGCAPVVLAVLVLFFLNLGPIFNGRWTVSEETTVMTEPLRPDGKSVDYFAVIEREVYPPEMRSDENGARILAREFGAGIFFANIEDREKHIADIYEKLGLDPNHVPPMKIIELGEAIEEYREKHGLDRSETNQYYLNFSKSPVFEGWIEEMEPSLDIVRDAFGAKVFCIPITRANANETAVDMKHGYYFMRISGLISMMNDRIRDRLSRGDMDGAIEDRISLYMLVRKLESQRLYNNISSPEFMPVIDRVTLVSSAGNYPNEKQLLRLLEATRGLPPHFAPEKELLLRKYYILDSIQRIALGRETEDESRLVRLMFLDWNVFMRRYNENWERHLARYELPESPNPYSIYSLSGTSRSRIAADMFTLETNVRKHILESQFARMECEENIREITYAMLLYHERNGSLPPAFSVAHGGRPLHSWRVLLLKELGHAGLYEKIRLDEPWDSEHNSQFHAFEIPVFRCPGFYPKLQPGETSYMVITGENTAFNESGQGRNFSEFGSGSGNLILVTERTEAVNWMRPDMEITTKDVIEGVNSQGNSADEFVYLDYPPKKSNLGTCLLGSFHYGYHFYAGFRDGTVRELNDACPPDLVDSYLEGKEPPE